MEQFSRFVVLVAWASSLTMSCAATTKEPTNPDTEPPPPEEVLGVPPDETTEPSVATTEVSEREPSEQAPVTADDLTSALQVVLQDEALLTQLKLEEPGRFPLKIAGPGIPSSTDLQAHAKNVEVVTTPEDPKAVPVLVFTEMSLEGNKGTFKYRYAIEGVRGTSYVARTEDGRWVLESSRISQY